MIKLPKEKTMPIRLPLILSLISLCCSPSDSGEPVASGPVRPPAVAGQFYPGTKDQLQQAVNEYLAPVPPAKPLGPILAVIAPHAGYVYSAPVAAYSFKLLQGQSYDIVVIIGKSHHEWFEYAAVYPEGYFNTPLGNVKVNTPVCRELLKSGDIFKDYRRAHLPEHSLEVEIPFLQTILKKFEIVPLLVGFEDPGLAAEIAQVLARALKGKKALIVCSTDLTHYPSYKEACQVDSTTLASWKTMDPDHITKVEQREMGKGIPNLSCTMCGGTAVLVTIMAAKKLGAAKLEILKYANSGDVVPSPHRVVGYGAAVMYK
jgi:AmmeMemoRadiSam system protein B